MSAWGDLLVCALQHSAVPLAAADVLDGAVALGTTHGWPPAALAGLNVQRVASLLKGLCNAGRVQRSGKTRDGRAGRMAPLWKAAPGDAIAVPGPPQASHDRYDGMSRTQLFTLLDTFGNTMAEFARQREERNAFAAQRQRDEDALIAAHNQRLLDLSARARRDLAAVGLNFEDDEE